MRKGLHMSKENGFAFDKRYGIPYEIVREDQELFRALNTLAVYAGRYEESKQADYASGHTAYVASMTVRMHLENGAAHLKYNQHLQQDIALVRDCVM